MFEVEYERSQVYIDVYYEPLAIAFECEGFVVHAEKITIWLLGVAGECRSST
ncbi:hypothetical protein [Cohnella silvisoli]|uniref:Uncharacterized protein n=1 Tax=Cohnella silvisoli TaxID=2873699 RepID=A0ABV1KUJ4_9BACL|nr:hypothetical protein [Cohnella silvisoli]MCD9023040.1 hypothetical protein [Cohnella silvisoli]